MTSERHGFTPNSREPFNSEAEMQRIGDERTSFLQKMNEWLDELSTKSPEMARDAEIMRSLTTGKATPEDFERVLKELGIDLAAKIPTQLENSRVPEDILRELSEFYTTNPHKAQELTPGEFGAFRELEKQDQAREAREQRDDFFSGLIKEDPPKKPNRLSAAFQRIFPKPDYAIQPEDEPSEARPSETSKQATRERPSTEETSNNLWQRTKKLLSREKAEPETQPDTVETKRKKRSRRLGIVAGVLAVSQLFAGSSANNNETVEQQLGAAQDANSASYEIGSFIPQEAEIGSGKGPDGRVVEAAPDANFIPAPETLPAGSNLWEVSHDVLTQNDYPATNAQTDAIKDWYLAQTGNTETSARTMQANTKLPAIDADTLAKLVAKDNPKQ